MNPSSPTRRLLVIKTAFALLAACFCKSCAQTTTTGNYTFTPQRFASIALVTTTGQESIKVETSTKEEGSERTIFSSKLTPAAAGTGTPAAFETPAGTRFTLTQLPEPIVNDGNRKLNSGDWKLTITGKGAEYNRLKAEMPDVSFGDKKPLVYLGTKDQNPQP